MRALVAVLVALLLAVPAWPEDTVVLGRQHLSLAEALGWAKEHHPLLRASRARYAQAEARVSQSLASNAPDLSVKVGRSHEWLQNGGAPRQDPIDTGFFVIPATSPNENTVFLNPRLELGYLLYDGGRRNLSVEKSRQDLLTWDCDWRTQWRELSFHIRQQYLSVVLHRALLDVQEENVRLATESLHQARGMVRAGRKPQLDMLQAEADLSGARSACNQQLGALNKAWVQLEAMVGAPMDPLARLDDLDSDLEPLPEESQAAIQAFEKRSDIKSLANQVEVLLKQVDVNDTALNPTLSLAMACGLVGADSPLYQQVRASIELSVPLNQGQATRSANQEVHALIQEVVEKASALRLQILGNIRSGYVALAEATRRVAIDQEQVEEAKESYHLAERRYRSGISQYLELTNARSVLNRARADLEQARFDRKLAEFQVMNELEILP